MFFQTAFRRALRSVPRPARVLPAALLLAATAWLVPAAAQSLSVDLINSRRELASRIWGTGHWMAFCVDEDGKDLNGDRDAEDTILCLSDLRSVNTRELGIAVNYEVADNDEDWTIAFSGGDLVAIQVSEADNGRRDLNGNGAPSDDILSLYNLSTRQFTPLGVVGRQPRFVGGRLYFLQPERAARKDLNNDGDANDAVLCVYDPQTRQISSLGMDAAGGYQGAGDWLAAATSESAQGNRDLNGDRDTTDVVCQVYRIAEGKWTSTGFECSAGMALTPKLAAVSVTEAKQGNRDLNGDKDQRDVVAHVWDLIKAAPAHIMQDCGGGLVADDTLVGMLTTESAQGQDLNGDKDQNDEVAQVFILGTERPVNLRYDGSGGIAAGGGRFAFAAAEASQGNRDLNRDNDTDDFVLLTYDPKANRLTPTYWAVDGDLTTGEGLLAWKVLEADQGDRDLNRDKDTDDSVLAVMDLSTGAMVATPYAASEYLCPTSRGVGFAVPETDQGEADANGDKDADDDVFCMVRLRK